MSKNKVMRVTPEAVKIHKSRGYGDHVFSVVGIKGEGSHCELLLEPLHGGAQFYIYKAHTYSDRDTVAATLKLRRNQREANQQIGLNKRR